MSSKVRVVNEVPEVSLETHVDESTGEVRLLAEIKEGQKITQKSDLVTIHSNDYSVIDVDSLKVLMQALNDSDMAKIIKMSITTKTASNILFNNNIPHSNKTLQQYLEIKSKSMFMKLIKRLVKEGALYKVEGNIYGEVRTIYMLNPHLSRRRRTFNADVIAVCKQFALDQ